MSQRTAMLVGLVLLLTGLAGCGSGAIDGRTVDYSAQTFGSERRVSVRDFAGRPLLLTSWATWCGECRAELPGIDRFAARERKEGLAVVAVNVDSTGGQGPPARMVKELDLKLPIWQDPDNRFGSAFRAIGVPATALIDSRGRLVKVWQGSLDTADRDFRRAIQAAEREAS